jgi:four helix bundle protein
MFPIADPSGVGTRHAYDGAMSDAKQAKSDALERRLVSFGAKVMQVAGSLPQTQQGKHISMQLLRSGTSAAPNYAEARAAESLGDFIHKLRIALKELNETTTWLQLLEESALLSRDILAPVLAENRELCRIIGASIRTARSG